MKITNVVRVAVVSTFILGVHTALIGWLLGYDPGDLTGVLGVAVTALGVGEASNVGKRATTNPELMDK